MSFSSEVVSKWRVHPNQTTSKVGEKFRIMEGNKIIFRYLFDNNNVPFHLKIKLVYKFFYRYIAMFFRPIKSLMARLYFFKCIY